MEVEKRGLSIEDAISIFNVYRAYAMQESNLINVRLTWILTIHGFLYATYGLTLQKQLDIAVGHIDDIKNAKLLIGCNLFTQSELFLLTIALVGISISILGWISIMAAQSSSHAVNYLFEYKAFQPHIIDTISDEKQRCVSYVKMSNDLILPHIRGGGRLDNVKSGHTASKAIPLMLASSWVISILITLFIAIRHSDILCI